MDQSVSFLGLQTLPPKSTISLSLLVKVEAHGFASRS